MSKALITILTLFCGANTNAQTWTFSGTGGSLNAENGKAICVDAVGNVYVTGQFTNTVDFDLGAGTANLTSNGANDIFIASYTSTGVYRWAVRAGGTAADNNSPSGGICTDGANVYVTGSYNGAGTLFGATSLTPNGGTGIDAFVAKLNSTTGAWTWAVSMGGTGNVDAGTAICLDPIGNPYLLGSFNLTMSGACGNVSLGGSDIFVSKLNPATGACVWMASGGSATNDGTLGGGICYDPISTELIVASTTNTGLATFGAFNVTSVGGIDMCVLELNSITGAWLGAVGSGSATTDDAIACAYDPSTGDVMVCGAFTGNMTLPGGIPLTNSLAGIQDAWVGRYSITTNGFVWAKSAVGTGLDRANGVAVDGAGSVLVTGQYVTSPTTFGALFLTNTNSSGFDDMFVVCYSAATGTEQWATKNTNTAGPQASLTAGRAIAFAGSSNYWITGQNSLGTTFGAQPPLNSNGFADFYVAKLNAPPPLSATQSQVNLVCNGVCTGSATVVASGGTSPYTYSWAPSGGSGATASSLCAGTYTCTITDALSSSITRTFNITQPTAIVLNANTQTNVSCFGGSNGAASVVAATGGTPGYTYNWTPGNPTGDGTISVTGLIAGTWTCTVTDANFCTTTRTFNITAPSAIVVTPASQTNISCFGGSNGAASINTPTGGAGGYTYNWTPGNPTGDGTVSVTGLTVGTWTCTVTDANFCSATQTFNITQPTALVLNANTQTNISCFGGSNGAASVIAATGGAGGYTYNWTPGNPTGDGTISVTGLTAGAWTCTVTDANACQATRTFNITAPSAIVVTPASQTNISCFGGSNGAASINTPTGGAGGYTYNWTPGNPTGDGTVSVTGLTVGTWTCTVTDANSCVATQTFNITAPTAIVVTPASQTNISCFGGSNGAASMNTPTGGAGGYTYNWTPGNPTGDGTVSVTGLTAGSWTCTVTDANFCTATQTFNITQPTAIVVTPASQTNISCFGGSNGAASINTPTGGAGGYTYNWTPGNPTGDGTVSVTGLTAGTWTCTVTDANFCTATQTFNITAPTAIVVAPASQTNISCFGGSNGAASINTPTGGAGGFTYNWTPGNPTGDGTVSVTGLTAGTWTCTVTDANSCVATQTFNITAPTAIVVTPASQTNISCFGGSNGASSINTPTGGAGGFTYNWTPGNPTGDGTVSVTGLTAGSWTCTVTDANFCTATQTFNITQPTAITASIASTPTSCSANTGTATVSSVTGGAPGYTYNWTPSGGTATTASSLAAGTYTCTITDANGCQITRTVTVTTASGPTLTAASQTNIACNGGATGAASVNAATGGTSPYTYNWTPGNPTGDGTVSVTGLTAGTWTCTVTDAGGCNATVTFNITQPTPLIATPVSQTNISCFGGSNGAASVSVAGGTTAYSYNWTPGNPTGDGTASVTGLTAGTWTCTVTDANSCTATQTFNITAPTAIVVTPASQTNISCFGGSNGAASINTPTGGAGGFTYNWTPGNPTGDGTVSVTGLTAGTWTCTVTDANLCTVTQTFNITQPTAIVVTPASQTNIACNGGSTGAASINTPTGGAGGYTYNWTPGNPTGDGTTSVTGLTVGTWTCTVTDANSCGATQTFNITQPTAITASIASTPTSCSANTGTATVSSVAGGTPGYTYNWTPSGGTATTASGLAVATYTCTITDANSCTITRTVNVTAASAPTLTAASQTNISCNAGSNGTASVNAATGGTGPYTYNWTPGNPTGDGTVAVTGLTAGTWTCTTTDAGGCTATATFNITQPSALIASALSQTNISCNAGSNGAASVSVTGGTTAYSYNWTPGNPTGDGTASVTGLTVGTWTCTVTDANACVTTQTFNITQPSALVASVLSQTNISCNAGSNGAASVSVTGGTTAYSYNWTPGNPTGDGTASVTGLTVGTWTCTVTDANLCTTTQTFNITQPTALVASALSQTNISCNAGSNGAASVSVTGGTTAYSFNWTPGNPTGDGTASVTGLTVGTWTCTVTDANSCVTTQTFNITQPTALVVSALSQTNISCNAGSNGAASVSVSGGTTAYSYNWTPGNPTGDGTASVTGLTAGTWTCTVTDANACVTTRTFNITQPSALVASVLSQTNISCNAGSNGAASVTVSGGTTAYSYNWTPGNPTGDGTASVTGLIVGTWTCTVTDANSCVTTQTFNITQPSALVASALSQTNISCNAGSNGAASVSVTGGTTAYSYNWTPGNPTGDGTASVTGLTVGTWTCTVTDANSCVTTRTFNITQPTALVASAASQTNILCNGNSTGAASVSVTGGTTAYSYNWTPGNPTGDGTASVTGLTAGSWTCTVTDANSCAITQTFNITQPISLSTTGTSTNISCFAAANGSITVTPVGGTLPYTYAWSPSGGSSATASGLAVGTYTCLITDANGCTTSYSVAITQPTVLAATDSITNITCFGQSNGAATVFPTGGTGPYTYAWSPTGGNAASASGLSGGLYFCTITDANGCIITQTININEPSVLSSTTMQTNVSCNGGSNGDAMVMVSGGTGPYTYAWLPSGGSSAMAMGLSSGTYTCTITDANGCTNTQTFNITQPGSLSASSSATTISCNGGNATVTVVGAGGTSPYTGTGTFTVTAGTYSYTVTDANGCTNTTSITVTEPTALTAAATATAISCNGGNATVTVVGAGGTAPYTGEGSFTVTAGTYSYTVTDANGCTTTTSITITEPTAISTTVVSVNVGCNGDSTGSIDLTVSGGTAPYTFDWNSGTYTTEDLTGLGAGTYVGVLTDANGCTDGGTIIISEPAVLVATVTTTVDPSSCGAFDGSIDITVSGGTTGYTYLWNTAATTEDVTSLSAGAYSCTVTDTNGCTATINAALNDPNAPTVTLALAVDTMCSIDGMIVLTGGNPAGGGYAGPGVAFGTFDPAFANIGLNVISYNYVDSAGCSGNALDSIYVDICTGTLVSGLVSQVSIYPNPNDGTFTLQVATLSDVMIYDAQGKLVHAQKVLPNVQNQINIVESGMYMITVSDMNGVRTTQRVVVTK